MSGKPTIYNGMDISVTYIHILGHEWPDLKGILPPMLSNAVEISVAINPWAKSSLGPFYDIEEKVRHDIIM
jgi:hypothetical protein